MKNSNDNQVSSISFKTDSISKAFFKAALIALPLGISGGTGIFFLLHSTEYAILGGIVTAGILEGILARVAYQTPVKKPSFKPPIVFSEEAKIPASTYPVDRQVAHKYLELFIDTEEKMVMQKAIDNIQHITFPMFQEHLGKCLAHLNQVINGKEYAVGIAPEKSNEWVFNLAKNQLVTQPKTKFPLFNGDSSSSKIKRRVKADLSMVKEETIVIFDDCAYSGSQIWNHLYLLDDKKRRLKVYVVIPFITDSASQLIMQQYEHLEVTLITSGKIKNLDQIFNQKELEILDGKNALENSPLLAFSSFRKNHTLCYTDWRYPDAKSIPNDFGRARIWEKIDEDILHSRWYRFIPKIPRVYGSGDYT